MVQVERLRVLVYGVTQDCAGTHLITDSKAPSYRIFKQSGTDSLPFKIEIDGESAENNNRDGIRAISPKTCGNLVMGNGPRS